MKVNDIHSKLNAVDVQRVITTGSISEVQQAIAVVRDAGGNLSIAGGRHAMGGQQFLAGGVLLDTSRLNRIIRLDAEHGLVRVEAGILWSDLERVNELSRMPGNGIPGYCEKSVGKCFLG